MSLITRCTACQTMFKVVPDQLRISEGWARCGQCGEVFDASQALIPDTSAIDAAVATGDSPIPVPDNDAGLHHSPVPVPRAPLVAETDTAAAASLAAPDTATPLAPPVAHPPNPESLPAVPLDATKEPPWIESARSGPSPRVASPTPVSEQEPPAANAGTGFEPTKASEDMPDVSFMRYGDKPSPWRKPVVRVLLLLLLLGLVAALAFQFLRHERDRIATMEPSTRPLLTALCAWSRCELAAMRQIESIVIDSSSFSRVRGENYRLAFSLKNNAALDLAMPSVELALTDAQDQAVVRRIIQPAEFGAASRVLAASSDWSSALSLNVKAAANVDRIAGYRLLAFYP